MSARKRGSDQEGLIRPVIVRPTPEGWGMDRRRFVMTASGILLASGSINCRGVETGESGIGELFLRVQGLAPDALTGGEAVITGPGELPPSFPIPGSGELLQVLSPGMYQVAYQAPSGYDLDPALPASVEVAVVAAARTETAFGVSLAVATGVLQIVVAGLDPGLPSGGSVQITRVDVGGEPPVTIDLPATGTATGSLAPGDYSVDYTPPPGYLLEPTSGNPVTVTIASGATQSVNYSLEVGQFARPDILDNTTFETGFDGLTQGSGGTPTSVIRSTEQAFEGRYSLKRDIVASASPLGGLALMSLPPRDAMYARFYFYATGPFPTTFHKTFSLNRGLSGRMCTLEFVSRSGQNVINVAMVDTDPPGTGSPALGLGGAIALNKWNSVEMLFEKNGSNNPRVRFWYNNEPVRSASVNGSATFDGTWLDAGNRGDSDFIGGLDIAGIVNAGNTNSSAMYFDRLAVSSQRIGP